MPKNLAPILGSRIGGTGTPGSKSLKKTAPLITKGDVVARGTAADADKWLLAAVGSTGPFGVCIETAAVNTTSFSFVDDGEILLTSDGAIPLGSFVMRSGTTAGQVVAYAGSDEGLIVGQYLRHEGEDSADQTPAVDGDIIVVKLGKGQAVTAGAT